MNLGLEHISRIESGKETTNLGDDVLDAQFFAITMIDDQYRDITQFLIMGYAPVEC